MRFGKLLRIKIRYIGIFALWICEAAAQAELSQGQFYTGFELGSVRLGAAQAPNQSPDFYDGLAVTKLTLGTFYASGRIDSYVSIPLRSSAVLGEIAGKFSPGIEGGYRFYLLPLAEFRTSPFVGAGLSFPNYEFRSAHGKGIRKYDIAAPVTLGVGFLTGSHGQMDVGVRYVFGQDGDYYFSPERQGVLEAEHPEFFIGYKRLSNYLSTGRPTVSVPRAWQKVTAFVGFAPSTAWFAQGDDTGDAHPPHLSASRHGAVIPEYSLGVVIRPSRQKPHRRLIIQSSYRPVDLDLQSYGQTVNYHMRARALEFLANPIRRFGIAPFFGVGFNRYDMQFTDIDRSIRRGRKEHISAIIGWDVLPDLVRHVHLRFTMRYTPELLLRDARGEVKFPNIEVNYVNLIWQF